MAFSHGLFFCLGDELAFASRRRPQVSTSCDVALFPIFEMSKALPGSYLLHTEHRGHPTCASLDITEAGVRVHKQSGTWRMPVAGFNKCMATCIDRNTVVLFKLHEILHQEDCDSFDAFAVDSLLDLCAAAGIEPPLKRAKRRASRAAREARGGSPDSSSSPPSPSPAPPQPPPSPLSLARARRILAQDGNCILQAFAALTDEWVTFAAIAQQSETTEGLRSYRDCARLARIALTPCPREFHADGRYLLHVVADGRPHCVAAEVKADRVLYHGGGRGWQSPADWTAEAGVQAVFRLEDSGWARMRGAGESNTMDLRAGGSDSESAEG